MQMSADQINQYLRSRRSVFVDQFVKDKKIPHEVILEILKNANSAPTHKITEPWRFIVFEGEGLKTLATKQSEIYKAEAGPKFKQNKYEKLQVTPIRCSHVIALCMKRHADVPLVEEIAATACAIQNIYLSLPPYGIGGYWSTGGITYMQGAKTWLGLNDDDQLMGFFFLGYIHIPSAPRTAGDVEQKIRWVNH